MFDESSGKNEYFFSNLINPFTQDKDFVYETLTIDPNNSNLKLKKQKYFLDNIYLYIKLPSITLETGTYARYCKKVAYAIVNNISLFKRSVRIDHIDKYILDVINELEKYQKDNYNNDYLNSFDTMNQNNDILEFFIPLPFWFTRDIKKSLYCDSDDFELVFDFEDYKSLIKTDGTFTTSGNPEFKIYIKYRIPDNTEVQDNEMDIFTSNFVTKKLGIGPGISTLSTDFYMFTKNIYLMFVTKQNLQDKNFFDYSLNSNSILKDITIKYREKYILPEKTPEFILRALNNSSKYIYKINITNDISIFNQRIREFYDDLEITIDIGDNQDIVMIAVDEYATRIYKMEDTTTLNVVNKPI